MDNGYFDGLIGQDALKRKLSFYLDAFKKTSRMPFLLFGGARGMGKTEFAKRVAKNVKNKDGSARPMLEINCSVVKNIRFFFEGIYLPFVANVGDRGLNIFWDECQNLPVDLSQALLTICNSGKDPVRRLQYQEQTMEFDFDRISMSYATTETDKLFVPLKDRFEIVDFEPYISEDLKKIVALNADEVVFDNGILDTIILSVRGNARSCVKIAQNISTYCQKVGASVFGKEDWGKFCYSLNILPCGLTSSEVMILQTLNDRGACSLNMLASATGLSRSAIQNDVERHLLLNSFINIDGKRKITEKGQKVLKSIKKV